MTPELTEIKNALDTLDLQRARELLREVLKTNPTADAYQLAALAALNEMQKREFLQKAIALDPFHVEANAELDNLQKNAFIETPQPPSETKKQYAAEIGELEREASRLEAEIKGIDEQLAGMNGRKTSAGVLLVISAIFVIAIIGIFGIIAAAVMFNNISKEEAQLKVIRQQKQHELDHVRQRLAESKTLVQKHDKASLRYD